MKDEVPIFAFFSLSSKKSKNWDFQLAVYGKL